MHATLIPFSLRIVSFKGLEIGKHCEKTPKIERPWFRGSSKDKRSRPIRREQNFPLRLDKHLYSYFWKKSVLSNLTSNWPLLSLVTNCIPACNDFGWRLQKKDIFCSAFVRMQRWPEAVRPKTASTCLTIQCRADINPEGHIHCNFMSNVSLKTGQLFLILYEIWAIYWLRVSRAFYFIRKCEIP